VLELAKRNCQRSMVGSVQLAKCFSRQRKLPTIDGRVSVDLMKCFDQAIGKDNRQWLMVGCRPIQ
jgi:hypothetical protein